jgi:DNA polymerase IV
MTRCILHIDMDAFFAAVEQLDFPELRGRPVVVGADPKGGKGRGVVSTCSYEARVFGIRSAMPISEAFRRCPDAAFVFPRGKRYAEVSHLIMAILHDYSSDIEPLSIDEAFLDISSTLKLFGSPEKLARQLKKHIRDDTSLTASVGIAPNKFIAKIASDLRKPDGLVIVEEDDVRFFLNPLEISRLWGVGKKTLPLLTAMGIRTIGDLADFSRVELHQRFGEAGLHYYRLANGIDDRPVSGIVHAKSISKEVTFDQDVRDEKILVDTLRFLCNELARKMRRHDYRGRTITLKIRLRDFSTFTRSRTLSVFVDHFDELFQNIQSLFTQFDRGNSSVRLVGVSVSNLDKGQGQLDMFEDNSQKSNKVDQVMDKIREKFGEDAITRASILHNKHDSQWIRD